MSKNLASPQPPIDAADSDVTVLAQSLHDCFSLINGIPSPDTFRRVFEKIRPQEFERCFEIWVREVLDDLLPQFITIDAMGTRDANCRSNLSS